jgi:two-component sensor histidine kinase/tetratricopeptide (TPR) repeat protein
MQTIDPRIAPCKAFQYIFCAFAALLFARLGFSQSAKDTAKINALIRKSRTWLDLPGNSPADLQKALDLASEAERLSRAAHYRLGEGSSLLALSEVTSAMDEKKPGAVYAKKALQIFQQIGDKILVAKALIAYGGNYRNTPEELPNKINLYEQAIQIFKDEKDTSSIAQLTQFLADLYSNKGDYRIALAKANESLRLYKAIGYQRLQGLYNIFGIVYSQLDSPSLSLRYNLLAAQTGEKLRDSGALMLEIYNSVGISFFDISYYDQAMEYFKKGLVIAQASKDTLSIGWLRQNMADVLRKKGLNREALDLMTKTRKSYPVTDSVLELNSWFLFMRVYVALGDLKAGKLYYDRLLYYYNKPDATKRFKQIIRFVFADYLEQAGRFKEAESWLSAAEKGRGNMPFLTRQWVLFELYSYRLDSAKGNYMQAIEHYKLYKEASDSAYNIDKAKQFDQLRVQYETEKKDDDIQLLTQKNQLQNTAIEKEKYTKNLFIAGSVLLLLLLIVIYYAFRQKQISNRHLRGSRDQIDKQNENLQKLVREKEWLLKEIHHRVKNNLQIVMSLLNTQSAYLSSDDAIRAVRDSQQRMYAMSLIHQRLYQADNISSIDIRWYVRELVEYMKDCYSSERGIQFDLDIDSIQLDIAQSVPLGLILNESISNAMKYAFPGVRKGKIFITLKNLKDNNCLLFVADNGVGLPDGFDPFNTDSLGMSLLQGLSEQLGGQLQVQSEHGLSLMINFRLSGRIGDGKPHN